MRGATSQTRRSAPLVASPLFLSESIEGLADGADFLAALTPAERRRVYAEGRRLELRPGESVFTHGEAHTGIFIIETGRVRVFYSGPSGREVTLAYWTPGNFIGGPAIHGGGRHQWSGVAIEPVEVTAFSSQSLTSLMHDIPNFALGLVEGLVAKAQCYTAMAQMLGSRSVIERFAQLILNLGELYGSRLETSTVIPGMMTHDEIAALVGATRQWVAMVLKRFKDDGTVAVTNGSLVILRRDRLLDIVHGL